MSDWSLKGRLWDISDVSTRYSDGLFYDHDDINYLRQLLIKDLKELEDKDYLKHIHIATFIEIINRRFGYERNL